MQEATVKHRRKARDYSYDTSQVHLREPCYLPGFCPGCSDEIAVEIEVSQRCALRQHSCKTLCSISADQRASDLEVINAICPGCSDEIAVEIEVSQVSQRCALRQHSCKTLCSFRVRTL